MCRIGYNKDNKTAWYIGLTKRKIKEHKGNMHNCREKTAIAKITLNKNININYNKTKKIAIYNNRNYVFCCKTLEIASSSKTCKTIEHFSIVKEWQWILKDDDMCRERKMM